MSLFEWILVVLSIVFWTILVFAFGFGVGYTYLKERLKEKQDKIANIHNGFVPSVSYIEEIKDYVLGTVEAELEAATRNFVGTSGPPGKDGKTPDADDILMYNGDTLNSWAESMYDRLKRVERKAGLSV